MKYYGGQTKPCISSFTGMFDRLSVQYQAVEDSDTLTETLK